MIDTCITMPVLNRPELTLQCITALRQITARPFFLTVVDNGSEPALREALQRLHSDGIIDNLILHKRNMGISVAGNAGWDACDHPYYVRMDNDMLVRHSSWLDEMVHLLDEGGFWAVGYKFCAWHETQSKCLPSGRPYEATEVVGGGCLLIPRQTHLQLGYWNEDYLYGWEDLEYCNRIKLMGGTLAYLAENSLLDHLGPEADARLPEYQRVKEARTASTFGPEALFLLNTTMFELQLRPLNVIRKFLPYVTPEGITAYTQNPEYKAIVVRQNLFRTEFLKDHKDGVINIVIPE